MKFSVTIPAYKSRYLLEAIESVVSQTYTDWELIIVDDCSPENLRTIIEPHLSDQRVHYYRNEQNCGTKDVVDNWNICLSYSQGEYVICIGDDDKLLPSCLDHLSKLIEKYPDLNIYHIQTEIIDHDGHIQEVLSTRPEREDILSMMVKRWNGRKHFIGDYCYRREHLKTHGGYYKIPYAWGSDDITAFRAAYNLGVANMAETGFQYRENRYSISLSNNDEEKALAALMQREWHSKVLLELHKEGRYSDDALKEAQQSMIQFIKRLIAYHILRDMTFHGPSRIVFWWKKHSHLGISPATLIKLYLKSIISHQETA